MKIAVILPHQLPFPPQKGGGVEKLVWGLIKQFARNGHEVTAYSRVIDGPSTLECGEGFIKHVRVVGFERRANLLLDHINAWRYSRNVFRVLSSADVASFHTPFSFRFRNHSALRVCSHTLHRTPKAHVSLYKDMDRVYCGSDAVVNEARRIAPKMQNLKRIYNCVEVRRGKISNPETDGEFKFLYVGRFVRDKGLESLIKGFEIAFRGEHKLRLETVGPQRNQDGADEAFLNEMRSYVKAAGLCEVVTFREPIFDALELEVFMLRSQVICVPSLAGETFSMAVLEAMSLGKPVLVSDFGPMPEGVEHGVTGYVATAGDTMAIAQGMRFFFERRGQLCEIGERAKVSVERRFSVEVICLEYESDFNLLLEKKQVLGAGL